MERITISLEDELAREFDTFIHSKGYQNRSEAVRDILRAELESNRLAADTARSCVGVVSYVYDHHERNLAERIIEHGHAQHDLVVSTMHAHLDHNNCIETLILRGPTARVRQFADALVAERGVRHGKVNLIPVNIESKANHLHVHARPMT